MKTVWILNHYAQVPNGPGGTRHFSLAKNMLRKGWRSVILAASTDHKTGEQRLLGKKKFKSCKYNGVEILWIRVPNYRGNNFGRIFNMFSYSVYVLLPETTRKLPRPNVIVGSSVHPLAAWAGAILAQRLSVPFIFEVRDLWPKTLVDMGYLGRKSFPTRILLALEKWLYRKAAKIIVLLPGASRYITSLGIDRNKIEWIPNGVELNNYPRPRPPSKKKDFTLMYFGAHGIANGLDCLIDAMGLVQKKVGPSRIRLRLIGDGPLKQNLIRMAQKQNLQNVKFEKSVPKKLIPAIAQEADGFIFSLIKASVFKYGISANKLYDYLAGARPIIFCCHSANNPVMEAKAGLTVFPGDKHKLADSIYELANMTQKKLKQMGKSGRQFVEKNHGYDVLAKRFSRVLDKTL